MYANEECIVGQTVSIHPSVVFFGHRNSVSQIRRTVLISFLYSPFSSADAFDICFRLLCLVTTFFLGGGGERAPYPQNRMPHTVTYFIPSLHRFKKIENDAGLFLICRSEYIDDTPRINQACLQSR